MKLKVKWRWIVIRGMGPSVVVLHADRTLTTGKLLALFGRARAAGCWAYPQTQYFQRVQRQPQPQPRRFQRTEQAVCLWELGLWWPGARAHCICTTAPARFLRCFGQGEDKYHTI